MPGNGNNGRGDRQQELSNRNVGRDLSKTADRASLSKGTYLQNIAQQTPTMSPVGRMSLVAPKDLVSKVDPPNAGDHSPSISAVNKTPDKAHGISGRNSYQGHYQQTTGERNVPTLQFDTQDIQTNGVRDPVKGSAAHTLYTSLREMHGVGESHNVATQAEVLDKTRQSYSPFNAQGEVDRQGVNPYRVNVYAESTTGPNLHKSNRGVEPMVAQTMVNLHYRDPNFLKRELPDKVKQSMQQAQLQAQQKQAQQPVQQQSASVFTPPVFHAPSTMSPAQQGLHGVQQAVKNLKRGREETDHEEPNERPQKRRRVVSPVRRGVKRQHE